MSSVGVGGAWKEMVNGTAVGVGGTWKNVEKMWVGVGGVWKEWFVSAVYSVIAGATITDNFFGGASAGIVFQTDGDIHATTIIGGSVDSGDWVSPKALAPGAYTIRATYVSGDVPNSGDVLDTDLALTSERAWVQNQSGAGTRSGVITLTLKDGGGNVLASGNVTLTANAA